MTTDTALASIRQHLWAIRPEALEQIIAAARSGTRLEIGGRHDLTAENLRGRTAGGQKQRLIAGLPLFGVITYRENLFSMLFGGTAITTFRAMFRAAMSNPDVETIIIDVDSPGGTVDGVDELAEEILAARGRKRVIALADNMAASAAYWIASAADELYVTPSGVVGSIGVFAAHADVSRALDAEGIKVSLIRAGKYKTEGNPYEPLGDEARAAIQRDIDTYYGMFVDRVADGRRVSSTQVRDDFGQGRVVTARKAAGQGMTDGIRTLDEVLAGLGVRGGTRAFHDGGGFPAAAVDEDALLLARHERLRPSQWASATDDDLWLEFQHVKQRQAV